MSRFHRASGWHGQNVIKMRAIVWETYPHVCHICAHPIPTKSDMHVDHLIPASHGGDLFDIGNVRPAHARCNQRRQTKNITDVKPIPDSSRQW